MGAILPKKSSKRKDAQSDSQHSTVAETAATWRDIPNAFISWINQTNQTRTRKLWDKRKKTKKKNGDKLQLPR